MLVAVVNVITVVVVAGDVVCVVDGGVSVVVADVVAVVEVSDVVADVVPVVTVSVVVGDVVSPVVGLVVCVEVKVVVGVVKPHCWKRPCANVSVIMFNASAAAWHVSRLLRNAPR